MVAVGVWRGGQEGRAGGGGGRGSMFGPPSLMLFVSTACARFTIVRHVKACAII